MATAKANEDTDELKLELQLIETTELPVYSEVPELEKKKK